MIVALSLFLEASLAIQIHAIAAVAAFALGAYQLLSRKGTRSHKFFGWVWSVLMVIVAISAFWIHEIKQFGAYSLIHLLSILTLISLPAALYAARQRNIRRHKIIMISLFFGALLVAGFFTFFPGRLMYKMFIG